MRRAGHCRLRALAIVALVALAGACSDSTSAPTPPAAAGSSTTTSRPATAGVTTTTAAPPECAGLSADAPPPAVTIGPARAKPGSVGAEAGFTPGGELFFDAPGDEVRELDVAAATGVRWLRLDLDWGYSEPSKGRFDWCRADTLIIGARQRGLDVLLVPGNSPDWAADPAGGDGLHREPRDPADYAAFVAAAVHRYAPIGIHAWEIWNEPNVSAFWQPRPNVDRYVAVLEAGYAAIKAADPTATVITGGLAPAADSRSGNTIAMQTFLEKLYAAGAQGHFDAIGIHPYSVPGRPMESHDWNPFVHLPDFHALMAQHGDGNKLIWLTEFGAPTGYSNISVHDDVQPEFASEAFAAMAKWPWTGPLFWYAIRDLGNDLFDSLQNWGLVRHNFVPKPGYAEFEQLMASPKN